MVAFPMVNKNALRTSALLLAVVAAGHFIAYKIVHLPTQLELVILLTTAFFYPIMRKPVIGVYLLFGIMPFVSYVRRLYYLSHQRPSIDPLIAIGDIVIALTLIGLYFVFREQRAEQRNAKIMSRVVLGYFLYCIIRTFFINILPVREAVMQFHFFGPSVLFFFIGVLYANRMDLLNRLWFITLGIGAIAAIYGMKQIIIGYSEAEQIWFSSISFTTLFIKGIARPFSIFQSPACFADYMLLSIIGLLIIISGKKSKLNLGFLLLLPLYFYGALITSVRSNWIGILLALVLWMILLQIRGTRNRIILILFLGILFIFSQLLDFASQYDVGITALFNSWKRIEPGASYPSGDGTYQRNCQPFRGVFVPFPPCLMEISHYFIGGPDQRPAGEGYRNNQCRFAVYQLSGTVRVSGSYLYYLVYHRDD